jgi:hypothetical protein
MNSQHWRIYFERSRTRRKAIPWHLGLQVEPHLREPLIHTLQRFNLGESGEGAFLKKWAAQSGDEEFMQSIDLFVREEQNHSHMMGCLLEAMDAPLLDSHWSDNLFMLLRHMGGLKFEIMMFLVAEIIAKRFFRALHDGTNDAILRAVFGQIVREEHAHVAFNCQALRRFCEPLSPFQKQAMQILWRVMFRLTCLLVMYDHRGILRAVGVGSRRFWDETGAIFERDIARVFPRPQQLVVVQDALAPTA